ncbi:MAG: thymidine phosphorylase [Clostridia bacterium]|nr:thymidine phosphorylase [Clostridia bacterium]
MNMIEIITKKKLGQPLSREEITCFALGAADGSIPDYQLGAMLMAIRLNGMTPQETTDLTLAMRDSGDVCDLSAIPGVKVDKHSTGGVGDTTTLILAPLVAACGVPVAKMSGRGLGHTGGTLDKLESIPGLSVSLTEEQFVRQVNEIGLAVIGQTASLAPADKTLYALRDVTSTVDSLPLIASSIMSKKLASGADAIVLDVKTGSGALMETVDDAIALAGTMVDIGTLSGKPVRAIVTGMGQPLGTHIGNALEVKEAIDVLSGRTTGDLLEVSLLLGSHMLVVNGRADTVEAARALLLDALRSGAGLCKLRELIAAQGGDPSCVDDVSRLPRSAVIREVTVGREGYVARMDAEALGYAAQAMGAGRVQKTDVIDPSVGYVLHVRIGDHVVADTPLCTLYARSEADAARAEAAIRAAITTAEDPVSKPPLWYAIVTADGVERV